MLEPYKTYVFLNTETGELRHHRTYSLNAAARTVGIVVPFRGKLPAPWIAWECWLGDECLWHSDKQGDLHNGPRTLKGC